MNYLDRISYDTGGYTVQEILSSFCKKILEIIDLVNKNEEVCDEAKTTIENIRNEVVPDLVNDINNELQDNGYFDNLVNVTLIEQLRTELTTLLNQTITYYTTTLDNYDSKLDKIKNELIDKINEVATKGTTTEVLQATTEAYMQEKINDGTIANLTIKENSITEDRLKNDYRYTLVREKFKELNYKLTVNGTQQDGTLHFTMFVDLQPLLSMLDGTECFSISADITPTNTNIAGVKCQIFSNNDTVLENFTGGQHIVTKFLDILGGTNKLNYSDISTIAFNKSYRYARIVFTFNPYDLETQLNFIMENLKIKLGEINLINLIDEFYFLGAISQSSSRINTSKVYNLNNDLVVRKSLFDSKITEIDNKILSISGERISKWTNKKWAVVGDSITAKTFRAEYNYYDYIKELIKCNVVNFGISGTGFTTAVSPIYNRIDSIDLDSDLITVFAGVNDHGQGVGSLGVFGDNDTSTLYGAIKTTIEKLINRFPNKHIAFFTPLPYSGNWGNNPSNNSNGYNIVDVRNAIIETCNNYSIPVLDLYNISNLRPWNSVNNKEYFSCDISPEGDGLHPNDKGHRHLADIILNFLNSL